MRTHAAARNFNTGFARTRTCAPTTDGSFPAGAAVWSDKWSHPCDYSWWYSYIIPTFLKLQTDESLGNKNNTSGSLWSTFGANCKDLCITSFFKIVCGFFLGNIFFFCPPWVDEHTWRWLQENMATAVTGQSGAWYWNLVTFFFQCRVSSCWLCRTFSVLEEVGEVV